MSENKIYDRIKKVISEIEREIYVDHSHKADTFLGACERLERATLALLIGDLKKRLYFEFATERSEGEVMEEKL